MADTTPDGRSVRWENHRTERYAELVEAAVEAIDRYGNDTGMGEIARHAGVSKPVLYRYFATKDALYEAVGWWGANQVLQQIGPAFTSPVSIRERIGLAVDAYLETVEAHPAVFDLLVSQHVGTDPLAHGKAAITEALHQLIVVTFKHLELNDDGARSWSAGIVALCLSTAQWWLEDGSLPRSSVGAQLSDLLWHGFEGIAVERGRSLTTIDGQR